MILLTPASGVIRCSLVTPAGATLTPGTPGITYVTGANVAYYRLSLPFVDGNGAEHWGGEWTALLEVDGAAFDRWLEHLERTDVKAYEHAVAHGMRYAVEVHSRSSLTFAASLVQKDIAPHSTIRLTARLAEFGIPVDGDRARVRAELTGPTGTDEIHLTPRGDGLFEADYAAKDFGVFRFRVVAEGRSLRGERFTREGLVSGSIYVPAPPEGDPEPPKGGEGCDREVTALLAAVGRNRRLAAALDSALQQEGSSLQALLGCLGARADAGAGSTTGGARR